MAQKKKKSAPGKQASVKVTSNVEVPVTDAEVSETLAGTSPVVAPEFAPSTVTSTQNGRFLMTCCVECRKPRVLYSLHKLTERQKVSLVVPMSEYDYTCGAPVLPPSNAFSSNVVVRASLTCTMPVEIPYYGSELGRRDICAAEEAETDQELKKKYKTVLPICIACKEEGKTPVLQCPFGKQ